MPVFSPSGGIELSLDTCGSLGGQSGGREASWALIFSACESNVVQIRTADILVLNVTLLTVMYLESVVFIFKVFDSQSLSFNLLPEKRRVHYLQWSCQRWRHTCL